MIRYLADHNLNEDIVRAVARRKPDLEFEFARDVGLAEATDPEILAWAAAAGHVVVTHDRRTMTAFAESRMKAGESMAGLVIVPDRAALAPTVDDLLLLAECWDPNQPVVFLPGTAQL